MLLIGALLASTFTAFTAPAPAEAATATSCSTADPGSGRYASTRCWFDFSGYDAAQASSPAGQDMEVALPGGSTLSFNVKASGGPVVSDSFPTYSAAYLGNGVYTGVSGNPALYQSRDRTTTDVVLSGIVLTTPSGGRSTAFSLVGADAESSDARESIVWQSTNPIYSLTADGADPGIGNACSAGFTGLGTREVTCSANNSSRKTGTPIVASLAPEVFSQRMVGGGRQAVAFGVLLSQIELQKQVDSRFTGDAFEVSIADEGGAVLFDAATGASGTSASTGEQTVIATERGATFTFSEAATSGSLDRYDVSWSCTRNGEADSTLPSGRDVGIAADVHVGIGDFVSCTIENRAKPTSLLLQKSAEAPVDVNDNGIADAGDRIQYAFEVTNTGRLPVQDIEVHDPLAGAVTCAPTDLAPGESASCTADAPYTASAEDQAEGQVVNTATATGTVSDTQDSVTSNEATTTTPLAAPAPGISLTKVAVPHDAPSYVLDQQITYTFVVTNTGNVPLERVVIDETSFSGAGQMSQIECPVEPAERLEPDSSLTCTATYVLQQGDIDAGELVNSAAASGDPVGGGDIVTSPEASVRIPGDPAPALGLEKSVDPEVAFEAGQTVEYTFHVVNRGNVTLTDPQVAETGDFPDAECPSVTLAPGEATTCRAEYTLTQADVDEGRVVNVARADAADPAGERTESDESSATVTIPARTGLSMAKSVSPTVYSEVGQRLDYAFEVTNTGNVSVSGIAITETAFTGSGELSEIACPPGALGSGQSTICTASYEVTQADIDAGSVYNEATAAGTPARGAGPLVTAPSEARATAERTPVLSLEKSADPGEASAGDDIRYRFVVTNTGNVSLADPSVAETAFTGSGELSDVHCPQGVLAPGASVECSAAYKVTEEDARAGAIDNTAVATAHPPTGVAAPRSNESSASVRVLHPEISLEKTADRDGLVVGDTVTYSFAVTNSGNVPLADVTVREEAFTGSGRITAIDCPEAAAALAPGESVTCTASYRVTQDDVDAGGIENTATAHGTPSSGDPVASAPDSVEILQSPIPGLEFEKTADLEKATRGGQAITYSFVLTNTGNVSLTNPTVVEQEFNGHGTLSEVVCPADAKILPGESVTCTATYEVVAADLTGKPLTNVATGTADDPTGTPTDPKRSGTDVPTIDEPGSGLPITGADGTALVVGVVVLLGLGAGALLLARRNRKR